MLGLIGTQGGHSIHLWIFLSAFYPLWHSATHNLSAWSSQNVSSVSSIWVVCWDSLGFTFFIMVEKLSQGSKLGDHNNRAHFVFHTFRVQCLSLPGVQCLKNCCFINCPLLVVSGKWVDLVTIIAFWHEMEVSLLTLSSLLIVFLFVFIV